MASCFADLLKRIEIINKKERDMLELECMSALPFTFLGTNNELFSGFGFSGGYFFKSHFFTVVSINKETKCAVLEVLLCKKDKLFRTKSRVVIDISCICGIQIIPFPVFDFYLEAHLTNDHFCLPFHLTKRDTPKTIWRASQNKMENATTISVNHEGTDQVARLIVNTKSGVMPMTVPKGEISSITVSDILSMVVLTPKEIVKGTVEIQLNRCEKRKIHF